MFKKNDFININSSHGELFIKNFESCLNELIIVSYNEDYIYIPNIVTFSNSKNMKIKKIFNQIVNLGIEIIDVEDKETFNNMVNAILFYSKNKNIISFKSHTLPHVTIFLNIENLLNRCVFYKITDSLIIVNDLYFTTNEAEFHGTGLFINKKTYLISQEIFNTIKNSFQ